MDSKSPEAFRTISEVAEWLGVPAHVLRFWESRFGQVKPVKRAGGRRYYRPSDMELLGGIRKLLHDDGMTIRGVQKLLREKGIKHVAAMSPPIDQSAEMREVGATDDTARAQTEIPAKDDAAAAVEDAVVVAEVTEAALAATAEYEPETAPEPTEGAAAPTAKEDAAETAEAARPAAPPVDAFEPESGAADIAAPTDDKSAVPAPTGEADTTMDDDATQDGPEKIAFHAHDAIPDTGDGDATLNRVFDAADRDIAAPDPTPAGPVESHAADPVSAGDVETGQTAASAPVPPPASPPTSGDVPRESHADPGEAGPGETAPFDPVPTASEAPATAEPAEPTEPSAPEPDSSAPAGDLVMPDIGADPEDSADLPRRPGIAAELRRHRNGGLGAKLNPTLLQAYADRLEALSGRRGTTPDPRRPS